jgi:hypothetical protein
MSLNPSKFSGLEKDYRAVKLALRWRVAIGYSYEST